MDKEQLQALARSLAERDYITVVILGETTDGGPIYTAHSPEIEYCIGQGSTPEGARADLVDARTDYIYSLLEDGLRVPEPETLRSDLEIPPGPISLLKMSYQAADLRPVYEPTVSQIEVLI